MNIGTTNLYCPGCAPGDFAQPHICGIGVTAVPQSTFMPPTFMPPPHEHCWCTEDRSRRRYVGLQSIWLDKVHELCCGCGSFRATDKLIAEEPGT